MSVGFNPASVFVLYPVMSAATTGMPSTTYNGALLAVMLPMPRTRMLGKLPGCPEPLVA